MGEGGGLMSAMFVKQEVEEEVKHQHQQNRVPKQQVNLNAPRPQSQQRTFAATVSVAELPTPLNFKKLSVEVSEALTKEGGMFSASFVSYRVRTEPLGYGVRRKDTEFGILRKVLVKQFPHIVVAPCNQNIPTKLVPKALERREKYYTRFL